MPTTSSSAKSAASSSTHSVTQPTADSAANLQPSGRLHGLDALRASALGLGIVLHSLMPFIPGMPWLVNDTRTSGAAVVPMYWIHLFRMVVFLMLAGYFGAMVLQRRGPAAYLKDRLLRIGLPLVAFWPVAVLSLGLLAAAGASLRGITPPAAPPASDVPPLLQLFTPGQLWFLLVLLECVLITLAVRWAALRALGADRCAALLSRLGGLLSSPAGVVPAAVPYLFCLLLQLGSYDLLVRNTWLGKWLNGHRRPLALLRRLRSVHRN